MLEELLAHFLAPVFAQLPGPAGVADVCTLESHLRRTAMGKKKHTHTQLECVTKPAAGLIVSKEAAKPEG